MRREFRLEVEMTGKRQGFVVALALVAGCLVASASPAGAAEESKLTFFFDDREFVEPPDIDPVDAFTGKVKSDEGACRKGRTIKVYFIGEDSLELVGTDVSNTSGNWSVEREDPGDERFLAKAAKRKKGDIVCEATKKQIELGDYEGPVDNDADDYFTGLGGDCDDTDSQRNPGATEISNFKDDDCDGIGDASPDQDADGFNGPDDCDDTVPSIRPGGTEVLDGRDQDCDGLADEIFYTSR